jgi:hypothetical protein
MRLLGKKSEARIAWLVLATALASAIGCRQPEAQDNAASPINAVEPAAPRIPLPEPPMDRAALLMAIAQAASAHSAGSDDSEAQRRLDGKPFELRIRFGCRGPSNDLGGEEAGWSFDRERRTLRVRATPTISGEDEVAARIAGDAFEAVEGFWLARPWLLEAACPATAAVKAVPVPPETADAPADRPAAEPAHPATMVPKFGIAQFFTATDSRTGRRAMRPYETVKTLEQDEPVGSQGFDLVLSGRLRALPDKRIIACVSSGPDLPPNCIVSADFDRVRIERADNREIVAEWGS